ncbi:Curlin associated [uncultured Caudovirales phage]|uniref:Curlin associated n=1 Tax=uncultured Caudovirales phage TaxID=2100421 RepID=A0A6J5TAJ1_9CAUD|nr:Curlin associated [uncultured Caudovirales phage]
MTGGGELSSKLLAAVLLSSAAIAFGQSAGTGPNKVYIEQVGSNNTLSIEQVGGSNNVGGVAGGLQVASNNLSTLTPEAPSSSNYGTITGSSNTLIIGQQGNANSAQYNIQGNNNAYTSTVVGNSNQTKLTIGDQNNASNLRNTVTETITGNNNTSIQNLVGSDIVSTLSVGGSNNQITQDLLSSRGVSSITITGGNNVLFAQQTDAAGGNGHQLVQNITGDFNSITTQQQGTNDTTVNIATTGSHNAITVRTSSSSISAPLTSFGR